MNSQQQKKAISTNGKSFPLSDEPSTFDGPVFASIIEPTETDFATVDVLQARMAEGGLSAVDLVTRALARIEALNHDGPELNAVIEVNPDALSIARARDDERAGGGTLGPLHGIPVLLKDNIDTADRMQTSVGALALTGQPASADAPVVEYLRESGAVIIGKANLTEWAGMRGPNGWSQRGGQTRSALGLGMEVYGSSSGSAVAVSAGLAVMAVGTDTSGSILYPAMFNQVVGMRPSVGLLSQQGVVPVIKKQDTVGPMARNVSDAAMLLSAMSSSGTLEVVLDAQALKGVRLGYPALDTSKLAGFDLLASRLEHAGATLVPVQLNLPEQYDYWALLHDGFRRELPGYLATRPGIAIKNLADVIAFNDSNPDQEGYGQEGLRYAENLRIADHLYQSVSEEIRLEWRKLIDDALDANELHALVEINTLELVHYCAAAGYPGLCVPAGLDDESRPTGVLFVGTQGTDQSLLAMGYAFEQTQ